MDLKNQQQMPLTGLQTLVRGLPMSPTGRFTSSHPQLTSAYLQHSNMCLQLDMQVSKDSAHTPPNGTHKPCHLHTHIPMDSTQILAAAQLCRIDRKNTTLNTSGHCPGKNKWEALSTHPDFAGLRKGKNILRLLP